MYTISFARLEAISSNRLVVYLFLTRLGELQVSLTDEFTNKKKGLRSQTYRIVYRSHEKALTKDEVNVIHKEIERQLLAQFAVKLR